MDAEELVARGVQTSFGDGSRPYLVNRRRFEAELRVLVRGMSGAAGRSALSLACGSADLRGVSAVTLGNLLG